LKTTNNLISQQLIIPPRISDHVQPNTHFNYNPIHPYPNTHSNYYGGMSTYGPSLYNSVFGTSVTNTATDRLLSESFSTISNAVQTFNAFNTLINTTYGAMYNSVSTIINASGQITHTKSQLLQIYNSINLFKIIKRFIMFVKRLFSGNVSVLEDVTSTISELHKTFLNGFSNSANGSLSYLFFITILCGPIIVYKFVKSIASSKPPEQKPLWDSQVCKSYAAKVKADFIARKPDELTVGQGEIVTIAPPEFQKEVNWYLVGNLKGQQGLIPSSFVSVLGVLNKNKNQEN